MKKFSDQVTYPDSIELDDLGLIVEDIKLNNEGYIDSYTLLWSTREYIPAIVLDAIEKYYDISQMISEHAKFVSAEEQRSTHSCEKYHIKREE